jgi:hypothetical protein
MIDKSIDTVIKGYSGKETFKTYIKRPIWAGYEVNDTLIPDNSDGFLERSIQSAISVFSDNWRTDIISL